MSREGEAVQGAVPREEGFASVLRRDAWVKPFFFRYRKALALALFLGLLTFGFASALMFTSGYLVSASAVVETILFLHLPLIFVRIFGVGKPILQYLERLTSHDWVLRMTSGLRLKLYRALERDAVFFRATHRLHWVHDMDAVLVMEDGRVAEFGAPKELAARDGAYARLASRLEGGAL